MGAAASVIPPEFEGLSAEEKEAINAKYTELTGAGKSEEEAVAALKEEFGRTVGQCLCGAVKVTVIGKPAVCAICHCNSCRHWTGSMMLVNLFDPSKVSVEGELFTFKLTEESISHRKTCAVCKSPVMNDHTHSMNKVDVCGGVLNQKFEPAMHLNYGESIFAIKDGKPKFKDMPAPFGGSGEMIEEEQ